MGTAAIICEYNPFHGGHRHQIEVLRQRLGQDTALICLMSGNYVQRGEPAIYDKWTRAEMALEGGADLVLELPLTLAVNAAGYFAAGGVRCLNVLGGVDYLCFGSEIADTGLLWETARQLDSPAFQEEMKAALATGVSYARAREQALKNLGGSTDCLAFPNSALGVDYLRELMRLGSAMEPVVVARDASFPSATALRTQIQKAEAGGAAIHALKYGERAMLAVLRTLPDEAFQAMPFGAEGLWSKVRRECRRQNSIQEILFACKSKRYTLSRLRRGLLCLYLGLGEADLRREIPYLRVLGFNQRGRALLRDRKQTSTLPLVSGTVPQTPEAMAYYALESRATDLYGLFAAGDRPEPALRERSERPRFPQKNENFPCNP